MGTQSFIKLSETFKTFLQTNTPYTTLMMAYEVSESARDNFGKFIYQFEPESKTLIRKLERILNKLYRQNVFLLFNKTYLNERIQPNHTHTHTHTHTTHTHTYIYIYIYIYIDIRVTMLMF